MSDKVKPALTREEWADWFSHHGTAEDRSVFFALHRRDEYPAVDTVEANRARAACALQLSGPDGKRLFTREDVEALRKQADALERSYALAAVFMPAKDHVDGTPAVSEIAERFRSIAECISSLLPPPEEPV